MKSILKKTICLFSLLAVVGLSACSSAPTKVSINQYFPQSVSPWTLTGDFQTYNSQNLFDYVDGQAESFFAYNFEQVGVQRYQNASGDTLTVEIWQLTASDDAYGLFTINRVGTPINIGNEGDGDPGQRLIFWQDRYYVRIRTNPTLDQETLLNFAQSISSRLPQGGSRPGVVVKLPQSGLAPLSVIYFHQETSIQSEVWLGGNNILRLDLMTNASLGQYTINGQTAYLLLVSYASADAATAGCKALETGNIDTFLFCDQYNGLLGAAFGSIDLASATQLVRQALEG